MQSVLTSVIETLIDLEPGQPITLKCSTTCANICLPADTDDGRKRRPADSVMQAAIPYTVQGTWEGIEDTETASYAVLKVYGQAAVLGAVNGRLQVVDKEVRVKISHVPFSAIRKIVQH